jgi:hypothetical protein
MGIRPFFHVIICYGNASKSRGPVAMKFSMSRLVVCIIRSP